MERDEWKVVEMAREEEEEKVSFFGGRREVLFISSYSSYSSYPFDDERFFSGGL